MDELKQQIEEMEYKAWMKRVSKQKIQESSKVASKKTNRKEMSEDFSKEHAPFNDAMTLSETAEYLDVKESTVKRYIKNLGLPAVKIHQNLIFSRNAVKEWLNSQSCTGA